MGAKDSKPFQGEFTKIRIDKTGEEWVVPPSIVNSSKARLFTPKGGGTYFKALGPGGPGDLNARDSVKKVQEFKKSWGPVEYALALYMVPEELLSRKLLSPEKSNEYYDIFMGISESMLDGKKLDEIGRDVRGDAAKWSKWMRYFKGLSDEQIIFAGWNFRNGLKRVGLLKEKSVAPAAVAAVAPVAVAAATGGLAGGGHRAQNRLLMALLLGLALWLLLKPKAGCPGRDRE